MEKYTFLPKGDAPVEGGRNQCNRNGGRAPRPLPQGHPCAKLRWKLRDVGPTWVGLVAKDVTGDLSEDGCGDGVGGVLLDVARLEASLVARHAVSRRSSL